MRLHNSADTVNERSQTSPTFKLPVSPITLRTAMVLVEIHLTQQNLSPPVFLAGTFTQWQPNIEMKHRTVDDGTHATHQFRTTIDLVPGVHQYKFRLGYGDWWVTDEGTTTICDDAGNINNVIAVEESLQHDGTSPLNTPSIQDQAINAAAVASKPRSVKSLPSLNTSDTSASSAASPSSTRVLVADVSSPHDHMSVPDQTPAASDGSNDKPAITHDSTVGKRKRASDFLYKLLCCSSPHRTTVGVAAIMLLTAIYSKC